MKSNFGKVIPLLADTCHVVCVGYDGFDETEETEKIENYIMEHLGGHIHAAYGCSMGGSFVGLLAARKKIHIDYGIMGSSDMDQASPLSAKLQTSLLLPMIYPVIRDGKIPFRFLQKKIEKSGAYVNAFMEMFGGARPYITKRSW